MKSFAPDWLVWVFAVLGFTSPVGAVDQVFETESGSVRVVTIADGLNHPWGVDFLPDGAMIVTERPGQLRIVSMDGNISQHIAGVPQVDARGQGGLLDVTLHPDFERNRFVYLTYAEPGEGRTNSTAAARGRLSEDRLSLTEVTVVFRQEPKLPSTKHFGSRVVFGPDGMMWVTTGERSDSQFRGQAQDLDSLLGKVVRLHPDGRVPEDNPFVGRPGASPEIWSYGHRNIQGAAIHPETGKLWTIEHGPRGGDEINIPEPAANYGWPIVSHGVNYGGTAVGIGKKDAPGMSDPIVTWTPVIAPGGMAFYQGDVFPEWSGNLLIAGLRSQALVRLQLDGDRVVHEERLLVPLRMRIRDVAIGPDGSVYAITDESDGQILRLTSEGP